MSSVLLPGGSLQSARGRMIPDRLAASAFEAPEAPFLVTGADVVTYGEADDRVGRLAGGLRAHGVRPGDRLAVWGGNDVDTSLALLAAMRLGAVAVPLNTRVTDGEARRRATVAGADLWVGHADAPEKTVPFRALDGDHVTASERPDREEALVVFTSGTAGEAKGVRLSRGALDAGARASARHLDHRRADRWLAALPIFHVGGIQVLVRSAQVGGSVRLVERFDIGLVAEALGDCTLGSLVSPMLRRLLDAEVGPGDLRAVLLGGGPIPPGLAEAAVNAGWPVLPTYGQTETASQVATCPLATPGVRAAAPLPDTEVAIEGVNEAVDGPGIGEIHVRGPSLFTGYVGEPDRDPAAWHATGDLGWLDDDGLLHVVGRADDIIVTGGENVHPAEVEEAIRAAGAADVAVVGLPDDEWGEVVAAAVVGAEPRVIEPAIRGSVPGFAVPRRWLVTDVIPTNAMGKPDRGAVRSLFAR